MERPKLTSEQAETIINLLRDNPGIEMTLPLISDNTGIPVEDLAVYLKELEDNKKVLHDTTSDGIDVYRFPPHYRSRSKIIGE